MDDDIIWDPERFEWDERKCEENLREHGVSFPEATMVFDDPHVRGPVRDEAHSDDEERWIIRGTSARGTPMVVVYCERGPKKRIISAWRLTGRDRRDYHELED